MPRKKKIINKQFAYHLYVRSNNRTSFGIPQDQLWSIYNAYLYFLFIAFSARTHAFTLMPNHFHILISFPLENMSEALRYFMTETARAINIQRNSINHVYGDRYKATCITNSYHFFVCYKYVYQNPLRSKLTSSLIQYPYTTLSGTLGNQLLIAPTLSHLEGLDSLIPDQIEEQISWLHDIPNEDKTEKIKLALTKSTFKFAKQNGTGKELHFKY